MGNRTEILPCAGLRLADNHRTPVEQGKPLDLAACLAIWVHAECFLQARCARRSRQKIVPPGFRFRGRMTVRAPTLDGRAASRQTERIARAGAPGPALSRAGPCSQQQDAACSFSGGGERRRFGSGFQNGPQPRRAARSRRSPRAAFQGSGQGPPEARRFSGRALGREQPGRNELVKRGASEISGVAGFGDREGSLFSSGVSHRFLQSAPARSIAGIGEGSRI